MFNKNMIRILKSIPDKFSWLTRRQRQTNNAILIGYGD